MLDDQELEGIVQRMMNAGEPEANIASVIKEYPSMAEAPVAATKSDPSISSLAIPAAVAANTIRPALNVVGSKVAAGAGSGVLRMGGRIVGSGIGTAVGAGLGSVAGPLGTFSGAGSGGYIGGGIGQQAARKLTKPLAAAGEALATATSTAPPETMISPVKRVAGRFVKGSSKVVDLPLPVSRRLVDALGKAVPGVGHVGVLSTLLDQQGDSAGLMTPGRQAGAVEAGNLSRSERGEVPRNFATGQDATDISLSPAAGSASSSPAPFDSPKLNSLPEDIKAEILRLLIDRN